MVMGSDTALEACCRVVQAGDTVLLLDSGVFALARPLPTLGSSVTLCALRVDVAARGLQSYADSLEVRLISDQDWVGLITSRPHTISWK